MEGVRRVVPSLAPWVDCCYGTDSHILLDKHVLCSTRGVQQGDPIGPAIFSLGIHDDITNAIQETKDKYPGELDWTAFFLDDGTAAGTIRAIQCFLESLRSKFEAKGLHVNLDKCEVIPAARDQSDLVASDFPGLCIKTTGNFKLLGAAFGSAEFCTSLVDKRTTKANKLLKAASEMTDAQCSPLITCHCGNFC